MIHVWLGLVLPAFASYPMHKTEARGGALANSYLQQQVVYVHSRADLVALLEDVRAQMESVSARDTAYAPAIYDDLVTARNGYSLTEHCGAAVYVIQRLFGGEAILATYAGERGRPFVHMWNRLPVQERGAPLEFADFDLTAGQFGGRARTLEPPGERLIYDGRPYALESVEIYRWDHARSNPLRPEIIKFMTAVLTQNRRRRPGCDEQLK